VTDHRLLAQAGSLVADRGALGGNPDAVSGRLVAAGFGGPGWGSRPGPGIAGGMLTALFIVYACSWGGRW